MTKEIVGGKNMRCTPLGPLQSMCEIMLNSVKLFLRRCGKIISLSNLLCRERPMDGRTPVYPLWPGLKGAYKNKILLLQSLAAQVNFTQYYSL